MHCRLDCGKVRVHFSKQGLIVFLIIYVLYHLPSSFQDFFLMVSQGVATFTSCLLIRDLDLHLDSCKVALWQYLLFKVLCKKIELN